MRRKIPSLAALMVFEAAARHQNFSRAADELALSESAVSKQIAALEDYLGIALFYRIKQRVTLSEVGRLYHRQVQDDLNRIERTTLGAMAYQDGRQIVELGVIPTFAAKWLIPQLPGFHERHPEIQVNLTERALPFLFGESNLDAALHYMHPAWAGNKHDRLFDEELVPACIPALLDRDPVAEPAALGALPLLQKSGREEAWTRWFKEAGCADFDSIPIRGPRYDLFSMVIEAACAGLGVALVPRLYILDRLRSGELVVPVDVSVRGLKQYCIVYPEHKEVSPAMRCLADWLLAQAGKAQGR